MRHRPPGGAAGAHVPDQAAVPGAEAGAVSPVPVAFVAFFLPIAARLSINKRSKWTF